MLLLRALEEFDEKLRMRKDLSAAPRYISTTSSTEARIHEPLTEPRQGHEAAIPGV